jgi:hypothetical protein
MNDTTWIKVAATREGGMVRRCHAIPHHGLYNIAQHSFGAVSLLLLLHPNPSLNLIKALQWHDVAERWLGDMPGPAKTVNGDLGEVYERVESRVLFQLGLSPDLQPEEQHWLKAMDVLELWLWCREEEALGNRNVSRMRLSCEEIMRVLILDDRMPGPAEAFYHDATTRPHNRLSDFWGEVERCLPAPP